MKVALLQYSATTDKAATVALALQMAREAISRKAQFILLPEICNFRGDLRVPGRLAQVAEKVPGPTVDTFTALAREHKVSILLGSIIEKADKTHAYNTSVFIDARGNTVKYRKIHLFDARLGDRMIREADCFRAGRRIASAKAQNFSVGLSICYDLRFPELYRQYGRKAVDILTVPSCFTRKTGQAHWEALLRARAIENLAFCLAPNQIGVDDRGTQAHGHSMVVSPWGEIIAEGSGEGQEIVVADIDLAEVSKARRTLPGIIR